MAVATPDDPHKVSPDGLTDEQQTHRYNLSEPAQYDADKHAALESPGSLAAAEHNPAAQRASSRNESPRNAKSQTETDALDKATRRNGGTPEKQAGDTTQQPSTTFPYNDEESNSQPKRNFISRNKKKLGIGAILLGGGTAGILGISTFILPLKVLSIVERLQTLFNATPNAAMQKMTDNLLSEYVSRYVLQGINTNLCTSTIEPTCVGSINANTPVKQLYQAWRQNHIETKLATDNGVVFGKKGGKLYMAVNGQNELNDADLLKVMSGQASIFDVGSATNITEARNALRTSFKDASLWDKVFFRFKAGRLIEQKYGVTRCIIACDIRDKFTAAIGDKKLAAQAAFVERVITPFSQVRGIMLQCIINPDQDFCSQALQKVQNLAPGEPLDDANLTPFEKNLQGSIQQYAADQLASNAAYDFADLKAAVNDANSISSKGFAEFLVEKALTSVFGAGIGELGAKAVPVVGWVLLAAQVIHLADKLGPLIRYMGYAVTAAAAVQLYMTYSTVASEQKSGHVDATMHGSFGQSLTTNMRGTANNQVDATATPLYGALLGDGSSGTSKYTCNDGSQVAKGQLICPEEKLDRGNGVADAITKGVNFIPGLTGLANIINWVNDLIGTITGAVLNTACNTILNVPPGGPASCPNVVKSAGQYIGQLANWFVNLLLPSPFSNDMSGGRTFDMIAAGADVAGNKTCQVELGCAKLSNQQVAAIRGQAVADQKAAFDQQPIFARMFSTTSPYSLISHISVIMPTSLPDAATRFGNLVGNPVRAIATIFGGIFAGDKAFAAPSAIADPFGVVQYGYDPSKIPNNPDDYWTQHCQGDFGTTWMNSLPQDPNTGEPLATTTEPCLLIQSMISSTGTRFNAMFAPPGSLNSDSGKAPSSATSVVSSAGCGGSGKYTALVNSGATFAGIDQGIDFTPAGSSGFDICAPVSGTIVMAGENITSYDRTPCTAQVREQLDQAPNLPNSAGYIYYAECIQINSNIKVGAHVNAGDIIGHNAQNPGIEVGWAPAANGGWLCGPGIPTPCGTSFDNWIQAISMGKTP